MDLILNKSSANYSEILQNCQIISSAFITALEENNCLYTLPMIFHQEMVSNVKDLEDISDMLLQSDGVDTLDTIVNNSVNLDSNVAFAIQAAKKKCFSCKLTLPKININSELNFSIGRLKAQIDIYKNTFSAKKPNLCQVMYAFEDACIPDILRLLSMLLTAFIAVTTLKKMGGISITGFIKGIISGILGKLLGTVRMSINLSSGNISCMIEALREFSLAQLQQEIESKGGFNNFVDDLAEQGNTIFNQIALDANLDKNTVDTTSANIKILAQESKAVLKNTKEQTSKYTARLGLGSIEDTLKFTNLNKIFNMVSSTVDQAILDVNNYIENMFAFKTYFECESKRSGANISDLMEYINNLLEIINMLSAISITIAKKDLKKSFCKTNGLPTKSDKITTEDIKDFLQNYYGTMVSVIDSDPTNLQIMLYEEPVTNRLPNLNFFSCNFEEFTKQHTLDNIVNTASLQLAEDSEVIYNRDPWKVYEFPKVPDTDLLVIKSILELVKENKETTKQEENKEESILQQTQNRTNLSSFLNNKTSTSFGTSSVNLKCDSPENVLKILESLGRS